MGTLSDWIPWLIAVASMGAFFALWFWEVRRILEGRKSTVDSAWAQLAACRRKNAEMQCDPEFMQVLRRSESIYQQAVEHYNDALHRPWISLPGKLMGFPEIAEGKSLEELSGLH